jgi:hypothetical protein
MRINKIIFSIGIFSLLLFGCAHQAPKNETQKNASQQAATELSFREFYQLPVGPYGLEPTPKLLSLKNKRVRIQGFMVKEEEPTPGLFMLTSLPVNIPEKEDGPSDELPGATLFVHMSAGDSQKILAYRPGMWDLAGTLQLGAKEETNGRVSYVRLLLDQAASQNSTESEDGQRAMINRR